jgi:hypothetical protein
MSQLNPLTASILQAPSVQRNMETDKARQLRQDEDKLKNSAATQDEEVDESVHSPDELKPSGDEHHKDKQRKNTYTRHKPPEPENPDDGASLDLTA